jgi:hypothetical protein
VITKKRINRKEKPLYYLVVASGILYLFQSKFFPVTILNEPLGFIFFSVLILIVTSIFFTRNRFLFSGQSSNNKIKTRVLVIGINAFKYFVAFGIVYYCGFLLVFNIYVKHIGSLGPTEFYSIPIAQVNKGSFESGPSIGFYFKEQYNLLYGNQFYGILKTTKDRFHPNRNLSIECRKSVFNSYLVDSYSLE